MLYCFFFIVHYPDQYVQVAILRQDDGGKNRVSLPGKGRGERVSLPGKGVRRWQDPRELAGKRQHGEPAGERHSG